MPRWEQMRYWPARLSYALKPSTADYTLEAAVKAREAMAKFGYSKMLDLLLSSGQVCKLYYPGIGVPVGRPGGDIMYVARRLQFWDLLNMCWEAVRKGSHGRGVYVTGAKGIGKSCYLRALAWLLILDSTHNVERRIICLWSMFEVYNDLLGEMVAALRFTYCRDTYVLKVIDGLRSLQDVVNFFLSRTSLGEKFYFIVDGVEALDSGEYLRSQRLEAETTLQRLLAKAHFTVCGVSLTAFKSQKRKEGWDCVHFEQGFWMDEYNGYLGRVSLLGKLDRWQDDIDYFASVHPLSLAVLDASCRLYAEKVANDAVFSVFDDDPVPMRDEDIVKLLQEKCEWEEVLELFLSSGDMGSVEAQAKDTAKKLDFSSGYHSQASMMEMDTTYVLGDPPTDYVTPYIKSIYTKAFRDAESRAIKKCNAELCRGLDEKVDDSRVGDRAPKRRKEFLD